MKWVSISFSQVPEDMVTIGAGSYVPLYGTTDKKPVFIKSFLLDVYPVTNQEYLEFLKKNPNYRKSKIKRLFAETYDLSLPADNDGQADGLTYTQDSSLAFTTAIGLGLRGLFIDEL